jgi:hypothetical protein
MFKALGLWSKYKTVAGMISNENSSDKHKNLSLLAVNKSDLNIVSALVQDAVLKTSNIRWIKKRCRFSLLVNRFRWELLPNELQEKVPFSRVQAMLAFDGVLKVLSSGVEHALENEILSILHIEWIKKKRFNEIKLFFSGDILIKLEVEFIQVFLQDLKPLIGAKKTTVPNHQF